MIYEFPCFGFVGLLVCFICSRRVSFLRYCYACRLVIFSFLCGLGCFFIIGYWLHILAFSASVSKMDPGCLFG